MSRTIDRIDDDDGRISEQICGIEDEDWGHGGAGVGFVMKNIRAAAAAPPPYAHAFRRVPPRPQSACVAAA